MLLHNVKFHGIDNWFWLLYKSSWQPQINLMILEYQAHKEKVKFTVTHKGPKL